MSVFGRAINSVYRFGQSLSSESMPTKPPSYAMLSHPGRVRANNEDTCEVALDSGAFVVCDGMGGAAAGEIASRMAAAAFLKALTPVRENTPRTPTPDVRLDAAVHAANQSVYQYSRRSQELQGMGTTLVALLLQPNASDTPSLTLANVGDSRCYLLRNSSLTQLTEDHSLVEEQVRMGEITAIEAEHHPMRNIITRAIGSQAQVEPDIRHLHPESGDLYLLASDGLTRELRDVEIAGTLNRALARSSGITGPRPLDLKKLCQTLIDQANDAGGGDNITVLLLHIA